MPTPAASPTSPPTSRSARRHRGLRALLGAAAAVAVAAGVLAGGPAVASAPTTPPGTTAPGTTAPSTADAASTIAAADPSRVLLVSADGLRWDDVSAGATPTLQRLLEQGSVATVATRSVRRVVCPVDGWLAVSAGARAADAVRTEPEPLCRSISPPGTTDSGERGVDRWQTYLDEAAAATYSAAPGTFGDALEAGEVSATAVGPGAAIALADTTGTVAGSYAAAGGTPTALGTTVGAAFEGGSRLVVVDVGALRDPDDLPEVEVPDPATDPAELAQEAGEDAADPQDPDAMAEESPADDPARSAPDRAVQVARLDARIGAALDAAPEGTTALVVSLADSGLSQHLTLFAATGPGPDGTAYGESLLRSSSTRQDGIVQATDVMPTLLSLLDLPPAEGAVGAVVMPLGGYPTAADRSQAVLDTDAANQAVKGVVPVFFSVLVALQLLLYGLATWALHRGRVAPGGRHRVLVWLQRVALLFASVPVASFLANLVPWWRVEWSTAALVGLVVVLSAAVTLLSLAPPWGRTAIGPFGVVAGLTAAVLAADVTTGSRLITSSLMGIQPIVAGRFYGFGNVQFALFATGALLAAIAVADVLTRARRRRLAVTAVVVIGVVTAAVDGVPGWGSDFGGPPAILPAFALLALGVAGVRVSWRRLLLIAAGTAVVMAVLAVGDWLRPAEDRTHLGRFVQSVLDGGAGQVVVRKIEANLGLLLVPLNLVVPFAAAFIALVLMRPGSWGAPVLQRAYARMPALRQGMISLLVLLVIGSAVNDSGVTIIADGALLAVPLITALSARVLQQGTRPDAEDGAPQDPGALDGGGSRDRVSASRR